MDHQIIQTPLAPMPRGHYPQGMLANGILYVSGQLPLDPVDQSLPESLEAQARQVLRNVIAIVEAAGGTRESIVQMQIFIPDISLWPTVNHIYEEILGSHKPARIVIPTRDLLFGALLEVNAIAHLS
jgi:2-iminobutanoate/2-iminopropanoate deaminase